MLPLSLLVPQGAGNAVELASVLTLFPPAFSHCQLNLPLLLKAGSWHRSIGGNLKVKACKGDDDNERLIL